MDCFHRIRFCLAKVIISVLEHITQYAIPIHGVIKRVRRGYAAACYGYVSVCFGNLRFRMGIFV